MEYRVVILQGPLTNRMAAVNHVLQMAFQGTETDCLMKLLVSPKEAGAIIGKQGGMLKQLRESSGLSVQVEKAEVMGDRLVQSSGNLNQIMVVARSILDVLGRSMN